MRDLRLQHRRKGRLSGAAAGQTWTGCSRSRPNAWWRRTTPLRSPRDRGNSIRADFGTHWPAAPSPFTSIWMVRSPCATDPTWWVASTATAAREKRRTRSAVEKAGAWKSAKTKSRFPPSPTLPWKSRPLREIPTFPPRRLLLVAVNEKPRRREPPKPKTGQITY